MDRSQRSLPEPYRTARLASDQDGHALLQSGGVSGGDPASVLLQGYPNLEYFVLDGKSSDGSVEIIKKYAPWLAYWVSERDGGQSAAINRGLAMGSRAVDHLDQQR